MVDATLPTPRSPIKFKRLFAEAVQESVKDYADANHLVRPGYWMARFAKRSALIPAMIAECPHEPGNPENILDTGPILIAEIGGDEADPLDVYAAYEKRPISESEYCYRVADRAWAQQYAPSDPAAAPARRRIDLTKIQPVLPFGSE